MYRPGPVRNFSFAEKKWGPQKKDFVGRYGFPGFFIGFLGVVSPHLPVGRNFLRFCLV